MTLRINGSTSGYAEIDSPAVGGNNTIVLPSGNGSANQLLKNGATAGTLEYASVTASGSELGTVTSINNGPLAGMRNRIINGGMQIAQRGAISLSNNSGAYGQCDRWLAGLYNFATATGTSRQAGLVNSRVAEIQATTTGTNASQLIVFQQRIEAANVFDLSGKTITMSATLYHDAGFAIAPIFNVYKPNALDNYSATTFVAGSVLPSLPSLGRARYTFTTTLGATDANNGLLAEIAFPINAPITDKYFQISEVQLEPGPIATQFERRPIGMELSLCQRYYQIGLYFIPATGFVPVSTYVTIPRATPNITIIETYTGSGGTISDLGGRGVVASTYATADRRVAYSASAEL